MTTAAQVNYWYQIPGGNLGSVVSVKVNLQHHIFASVVDKGIFRSVDSGKVWTQVAPHTNGMWTFEISTVGKVFSAHWLTGTYVSTDNGTTWAHTPENVLNADIRSINSQNHLFIEASGLTYRSTNEGGTWTEISDVRGGIVASLKNKKMYAAKGTTLAISNDDGTTWTIQQLNSSAYAVSADTFGNILVGAYCDDAARTPSILQYDSTVQQWNRVGPHSTVNAIVRHPSGRVFAATHDSGCYIHDDTSTAWTQKNSGLSTTKIYSLAFLSDNILVAGTLNGIFFSSTIISTPLPVELVSFTAHVTGHSVALLWKTATEVNNFGFEIERKPLPIPPLTGDGIKGWGRIGFVEGSGTSNAPKEYLFVDAHVVGKTSYRLKQIDRDGQFSYSQEIEVVVLQIPQNFMLMQNYPNPFNPTTVINYQLTTNSFTTLKMYDVLGKEVAILVNETKEAGSYSVQLSMNNYQLPSGVYFYTLRANNFNATKSMLLVK